MLHLHDSLTDAEQMSELFSHAGIWIVLLLVVVAVVSAARRSRASSTTAVPAPTKTPQHPTEP